MSRSRRFLVKSMRLAHLACRLSVALFSVSSQGIAVLAKPKHVGNFYRGIEACSGGFRLQGFAVKVRQFRLKAYNRASVIQGKWVQSTVSCGPGQGEHEAKRAVSGACSMPKFRVEGPQEAVNNGALCAGDFTALMANFGESFGAKLLVETC